MKKLVYIILCSLLFINCIPVLEQARLIDKYSVVTSLSGYGIYDLKDQWFGGVPVFTGIQIKYGLTEKNEISFQTTLYESHFGNKFYLYNNNLHMVSAKIALGYKTQYYMRNWLDIQYTLFYGYDFKKNFHFYAGTGGYYLSRVDFAHSIFVGSAFYPFDQMMHAVKVECGFCRQISLTYQDYIYFGISTDLQVF